MLLLAATISCAAERPEYAVQFIEQPPALDGSLDEAVWTEAPEPPTVTALGVTEDPAQAATRLRMLAGEEAHAA